MMAPAFVPMVSVANFAKPPIYVQLSLAKMEEPALMVYVTVLMVLWESFVNLLIRVPMSCVTMAVFAIMELATAQTHILAPTAKLK